MFSKSIQKLIDIFVKFPTVGPRTAARFVFHLIKLPQEKTEELTSTISELKKEIKLCSFCFKPFQPAPPSASRAGQENQLCEICSNSNRDKNLLCVVEKETDLESIENTQQYKGFYFVLGDNLGKFSKAGNEELADKIRLKELIERIKNPSSFGIEGIDFQEIIIATNPTIEGEATAVFIEKLLKKNLPSGRRVTRLGKGLPVGGELEYADEETLKSAFEGRK